MIIIDDIKQGSDEWKMFRLGIPSASNFSMIITPTGKTSTQAEGYMNRLLAEWLTGKTSDIEQSEWMKRGIEMEAEARDYYAFRHDVEIRQVGIVYRDEKRLVSCSPDGLHGDGGLEIKCPAPHTHVGYLLNGFPNDYTPQVQGSMYVTGAQWWDFISYHPDMEPVIVRVMRDDAFIKTLDGLLTKFLSEMQTRRDKLKQFKRGA